MHLFLGGGIERSKFKMTQVQWIFESVTHYCKKSAATLKIGLNSVTLGFFRRRYTIKAMLGLSKVSKYVITSLTMRCSSTGRAYRPIMVTADLRLKRRQSSKCSVAAGKSVEQLVRAARRDNMKTDIYDVKSLQHYRLSDPTADSDPRPGDCRWLVGAWWAWSDDATWPAAAALRWRYTTVWRHHLPPRLRHHWTTRRRSAAQLNTHRIDTLTYNVNNWA